MKVKIFTLTKTEKGSKDLPAQFNEAVRPDIIRRAVEVIRGNKRQPYGADPMAGKRQSTKLSRRRRDYRGSYGHGISRVPRKILSRRGTQFSWVGAFAPGTVGGRRAHPPKAERIWSKKINAKERKKAIRSALAATMTKELVAKRGHAVPDSYPFIIEDKFETLQKTKDVKQILEKLGFEKDLARALSKTLRGGIAKMRGRKYRVPRGPLIVVSDDCPLKKAASNIPGVDIITAKNLNVELLAPGGECGRLTLFTESAIEQLKSKNLFLNIKMKQEKRQNPAVEKKETAKKTAKGMKPAQKPEAAPKKQQAAK